MIKHIKCNIFESGADIICHQVNCQGVMGSGIAKQVREKFPSVYEAYISQCKKQSSKELLGGAQIVQANNITYIANLFGQNKYGYDGKCYTDYKALESALFETAVWATINEKTKIAIPYKLGCARGGGDWNIVYEIITRTFDFEQFEVLICEYNGG